MYRDKNRNVIRDLRIKRNFRRKFDKKRVVIVDTCFIRLGYTPWKLQINIFLRLFLTYISNNKDFYLKYLKNHI